MLSVIASTSGAAWSLTIGNSVTSIGNRAFFGNPFTGSLTIPNSVTSIGNEAFGGNLDTLGSFTGSLTIGNSVTSIGDEAFVFRGFTGSLTIPNSVTSIGTNPFSVCSGLEHIAVALGNTVYDSRNNCNAIIKTNTNELITGCMNSHIPNSVTSIGNSAFYGCYGLTGSLIIGDSVATIGDYAFLGCYGLTGSLIIGNSVTSIGDGAFGDCGFTGSLTIPNSVTSIGWNPFSGCSGLEHIEVASGNMVYDSRNNCNAIIKTNTNELITGCMNSHIPNSVATIGDYAFSGCYGLTGSLIIGNSVATIGDYAFRNCSGLTSITVLVPTPPSVGTDAFYNVNPDIPVTVPCGCIPVYEASDWHNYFTTILEDCTAISEDDENTITVYPNPTNGQVRIEVEALKYITISNMLGQVIYEGKASGNTFEYDFSKHGAGLYLVRIETVGGVVVKKVSVTR